MDAELAKVEKRDAEREEEENTNIKKGTNEGKQKMRREEEDGVTTCSVLTLLVPLHPPFLSSPCFAFLPFLIPPSLSLSVPERWR